MTNFVASDSRYCTVSYQSLKFPKVKWLCPFRNLNSITRIQNDEETAISNIRFHNAWCGLLKRV